MRYGTLFLTDSARTYISYWNICTGAWLRRCAQGMGFGAQGMGVGGLPGVCAWEGWGEGWIQGFS